MINIKVGDYAIVINDIYRFPFAKGAVVQITRIDSNYESLQLSVDFVNRGIPSAYSYEELQVVTKEDNPEYFI
jgi:hypothetical protein